MALDKDFLDKVRVLTDPLNWQIDDGEIETL